MEETKKCNVCYDELKLENSVKTVCNHFFCSDCFFRWMLTNNTCPMCRLDFCNRVISRTEMVNYSDQILEILLEGESIAEKNMALISENKDLIEKKKNLVEKLDTFKMLEKKELELVSKISNKCIELEEILKNQRKQIRLLKIKKINLQKKKLKLTGHLSI